MRLFQRRQRDADRAAKPTKPSESIPPESRGQIGHALSDHVHEGSGDRLGPSLFNTTDWMVLNDHIKWVLARAWGAPGFADDDIRYLLFKTTDGQVLDIIEAWFPAMKRVAEAMHSSSGYYYPSGSPTLRVVDQVGTRYRERINDIFEERDVAWALVGERIVPRASAAMHATVVEPVFAFTQGEPRLAAVEKSFQDALRELKPDGDPSDAITDAGRALQEMLVVAGAHGNALGPLLADARRRELLSPYDSKLADGVEALGEWVSADRSQRGDTHHVRDASRDDAWLAVRVAGALILRLAAGRKR
jgi:hypothetical protein